VSEKESAALKTKSLFQAIAFYLGENIYALDIMNIKDIITFRTTYRVPNTNERLLGVLNLRSEILPLYSLKLILEMDDPMKAKNLLKEDEDQFVITVKKDKDIFAIPIDGIYKNVTATEENFRGSTYLNKWSKNYLFDGVILEEDKEILTINIDNLLQYMVSLK
jgi:purine-binding chemotaxis protein CheW